MKIIVFLILTVLVLFACVTAPPPKAPEINELLEHWVTGLREENIDVLMSTYWPDAELVMVQPDGKEQHLRGHDEIERFQIEGFQQPGSFRDLNFSKPEGEIRGNSATYLIHVEAPGVQLVNHFELIHRDGQWRIIHQVIDTRSGERPAGIAEGEGPPRVASDFQSWADRNHNGILEPPELHELYNAVFVLLHGPHPTHTQVDEFFDINRDGKIDPIEVEKARSSLIREQIRELYQRDPDLARMFDFNNDEYISLWEVWLTSDQLFHPPLKQTRDAQGPRDKRIDKNRDGFLNEAEIEAFTRHVFSVAVLIFKFPTIVSQPASNKNDIFVYVDLNNNGSLESPEKGDLVFVFMETLSEPDHGVHNPLDEYFDSNRNRRLENGEMMRAQMQILKPVLRQLFEYEPWVASQFVDRNQNRKIDEEEIEFVLARLRDPQFRYPHRVEGPLDERIDRNKNGMVDGQELDLFLTRFIYAAAISWLEIPAEKEERWAVHSVLDELSDINGDGFVTREENQIAREGFRGPHRVENEFDRRIDFNRDGEVTVFEIIRAQRAGELPLEEMEAPSSLPVVTPVDGLLDLNKDGKVDEDEIRMVIQFLQQPKRSAAPGQWWELLDLDRNGRVDREELIESQERYFRPHPVNSDFRLDQELDKNVNGFVEPEEIGIAAGFTEGRPIPSFDERLEQLGWQEERVAETAGTKTEETRFESEYYKKLGMIQDKKLAVMGINRGTKNVNEETASGVMVFIENAFVNVGKVRVVDRQNIAKIVKEYEFQLSDLADESTAVEIGKLSGADIIVIGSISYVGEMYYLNIKLISVETAEIIGSSIADAVNAKEFYEMCNEAVFKLF